MTRAQALHRVVRLLGGEPLHGDTLYRFLDTAAADEAVTVLNALEPGCTGDVVGTGIIALMPDPSR